MYVNKKTRGYRITSHSSFNRKAVPPNDHLPFLRFPFRTARGDGHTSDLLTPPHSRVSRVLRARATVQDESPQDSIWSLSHRTARHALGPRLGAPSSGRLVATATPPDHARSHLPRAENLINATIKFRGPPS